MEIRKNKKWHIFSNFPYFSGEIKENTTCVLVNAVHFKDQWEEKFTMWNDPVDFHKADGSKVILICSMIHGLYHIVRGFNLRSRPK